MMVHEILRSSQLHIRSDMDFQLAVLQDVCEKADAYWRNWLWNRQQCMAEPSAGLLRAFPERDPEAVSAVWREWFGVLTSWEYADALTGCDVRQLLGDFARP